FHQLDGVVVWTCWSHFPAVNKSHCPRGANAVPSLRPTGSICSGFARRFPKISRRNVIRGYEKSLEYRFVNKGTSPVADCQNCPIRWAKSVARSKPTDDAKQQKSARVSRASGKLFAAEIPILAQKRRPADAGGTLRMSAGHWGTHVSLDVRRGS